MDHKVYGARKILEIKSHNEISVNNITYKVDSLDCDINLLDWIRDNTPFKGTNNVVMTGIFVRGRFYF